MKRQILVMLAVTLTLALAQNAPGQEPGDEGETAEHYQTQPAAPVTPMQIIQYKAQVRAQQRMARMASMQWYGMSASRPRASATPFAGMSSPMWQMPGGRPFAWTPRYTPSVVIVR